MARAALASGSTTTVSIPTVVTPVADSSNPTISSCLGLTSDFGYRTKDSQVNDDVSALQDFLHSGGYLNSEPTGYYGIMTVEAVKVFQIKNRISVTGYIGPLTRNLINKLSCDQSSQIPATTQVIPGNNNASIPTTVVATQPSPITTFPTTPSSPITVIKPYISNISSNQGKIGDSVTIYGSNLKNMNGDTFVRFSRGGEDEGGLTPSYIKPDGTQLVFSLDKIFVSNTGQGTFQIFVSHGVTFSSVKSNLIDFTISAVQDISTPIVFSNPELSKLAEMFITLGIIPQDKSAAARAGANSADISMTKVQLVELFISVGIIPAEKATAARSAVGSISVPATTPTTSSIPKIKITDITADERGIYVSYANSGVMTDRKFLIGISTPFGSFSGNSLYPLSVPTNNDITKTGSYTLGLVGLGAGATADITAKIIWQNPAETDEVSVFSKRVTIPGGGSVATPVKACDSTGEFCITVDSPNGGESLVVGKTYRIKWTATPSINKVSIGYSYGPGSLNWIANDIPNTGYYDWPVNVRSLAKARIEIDRGSVAAYSSDYINFTQ